MVRDCSTTNGFVMTPRLAERGRRLPADQREFEHGQDARLGRTNRGHRVHAVRRRADDAVLRPLAADLRVKAVDGDGDVRIAADLHLVPLASWAECPWRIKVFLAHQPVHRHTHDGFPVDEGFPVEPAARDLAWLEEAKR